MKIKAASIFLTIGLLFTSCSDNGLEITKKGKSVYEIVLIGKSTMGQHASAEVLQSYIEKISGAKLEIVVEASQRANMHKLYIGNKAEEKLGLHQIKIKSERENIYILGGSEEAQKNAVYEFLEQFLACKWYAPNIEKIPESATIKVKFPIHYSYTPEITTRTVHSRLYYENEDFADKQKVTTQSFPHYVPKARVHTFHRFIPEEKYYDAHPEYFAWRGDKRLPTQLCLTNEAVLGIVIDSVKSLFKRHPEASVVSVSQDDNQQHCLCDTCSAIDAVEGSPSGTMIQFVNKVAKAFPDKTISTLAYQYTRKPSKTKPAKNVLITLCSIECDRSGPIDQKCTDFAEDLKGWGRLTDNIRIWDYTTQFTNFLAPFPNIHTLRPNINLFSDNGAKWVFEQHSSHPSELFELRSYITAKLLWNPALEMEALLTEFTDGYYEEAGIYVKQYVDAIHSRLKEDDDFFLFLYGDPSEAFDSYLSRQLLVKYSNLFDKAENVVNDKPEILWRVKTARLGVDYAVLEACRKGMSDTYSLVSEKSDGTMEVNSFAEGLLENFKLVTEKANITLMNEMRFTVDEYIAAYEKALEVAKQPNMALDKKVTLGTVPKKYADEDPQVLTDGALGGNGFYANWLGFEGNNLEAIIDLEAVQEINNISMAYLQVTNHVVFFPTTVSYYGSMDNKDYSLLGTVHNTDPLTKESKINDIQYFDLPTRATKARYIKIIAENMGNPPYWHHAAGTPSWIFSDEILVN